MYTMILRDTGGQIPLTRNEVDNVLYHERGYKIIRKLEQHVIQLKYVDIVVPRGVPFEDIPQYN